MIHALAGVARNSRSVAAVDAGGSELLRVSRGAGSPDTQRVHGRRLRLHIGHLRGDVVPSADARPWASRSVCCTTRTPILTAGSNSVTNDFALCSNRASRRNGNDQLISSRIRAAFFLPTPGTRINSSSSAVTTRSTEPNSSNSRCASAGPTPGRPCSM